MGRRAYTDSDKASVYVALRVNDGNVKRTARDTGVAETTVRDWKSKWTSEGLPPAVQKQLDQEAKAYVDRYEAVRDKALIQLEDTLAEAKPRDLITIVGVLDDKITRARGLATSRSEVIQRDVVPPEERARQIAYFVKMALEASRQRDDDIIDAEVISEQAPRALGTGGNA